jgi:beta-N-acetylhexosaminidase
MILLAHMVYPAVDPDAPVALSRRFATGILREELGFAGVAISDDIGMGAMKGLFDNPKSAVRLIESGCDMVMVCAQFTGTGRARGFAQAILAAIEEGRLDSGLLARSRARIENLLSRAATNEVELLPESMFRTHANAAALYDAATVEVV